MASNRSSRLASTFRTSSRRTLSPSDAGRYGGLASETQLPTASSSGAEQSRMRTDMDSTNAVTQLEAAVANQLMLAGADESVDAAAEAVLAAIEPAMRAAVLDLAEQAATELDAQLPGHRVDVVMVEGEPTLRAQLDDRGDLPVDEDYEARISLRLPGKLKELIEESAGDSGDSVNSWVVKAVSSNVKVRKRSSGTRVTGTLDT